MAVAKDYFDMMAKQSPHFTEKNRPFIGKSSKSHYQGRDVRTQG